MANKISSISCSLVKNLFYLSFISRSSSFVFQEIRLFSALAQSRGIRSPATSINNVADFSRVVIEQGKAKLFQNGNPLIYGGAVKNVIGNPGNGDECEVVDYKGNSLGRGVFNSISQYRVRVLVRSYEKDVYYLPFSDVLKTRFIRAIELRKRLNLPSLGTNVYRLVNGEGDRLSGLNIDVISDYLIIQSSAFWVEKHKQTIIDALKACFPDNKTKIVWRRSESRLKQDGWVDETKGETEGNITPASLTTQTPASTKSPVVSSTPEVMSEIDREITVKENDIAYIINPSDQQKTGALGTTDFLKNFHTKLYISRYSQST